MLDYLSLPLIVAGSFIGLLIAYVLILCTCYVTCGMDDALVRSGLGGAKVAIQTGLWRFPLIHKLRQVSLRTVAFNITTTDVPGPLRDKGLLPLDFNAEVYVHVPAKTDYVILAAQTLEEIVGPRVTGNYETRVKTAISDLSKKKVASSIKHAATTMTLSEMHNNQLTFIERVADHVENDLKGNGLKLESISIRSLDQGSL